LPLPRRPGTVLHAPVSLNQVGSHARLALLPVRVCGMPQAPRAALERTLRRGAPKGGEHAASHRLRDLCASRLFLHSHRTARSPVEPAISGRKRLGKPRVSDSPTASCALSERKPCLDPLTPVVDPAQSPPSDGECRCCRINIAHSIPVASSSLIPPERSLRLWRCPLLDSSPSGCAVRPFVGGPLYPAPSAVTHCTVPRHSERPQERPSLSAVLVQPDYAARWDPLSPPRPAPVRWRATSSLRPRGRIDVRSTVVSSCSMRRSPSRPCRGPSVRVTPGRRRPCAVLPSCTRRYAIPRVSRWTQKAWTG